MPVNRFSRLLAGSALLVPQLGVDLIHYGILMTTVMVSQPAPKI